MSRSLIEIPQQAADAAAKLQIVKDIHSADFIFHFIAQSFPDKPTEAILQYYRNGHYSAKVIAQVVADHAAVQTFLGTPWKPARLLDFASGYGCVARHIPRTFPGTELQVADIHPAAMAFNKDLLGFDGALSTTVPEEWAVPAEGFDVIFVLSLFSHLPRQTFTRWLTAICRALKRNGILIFTTHGRVSHRHNLGWIPLDSDDFGFATRSEQKDLDSQDYGTAVSYPKFVWESIRQQPGVALTRFQEGFWWRHQDLYVLEKL
jgi:SAM-dependent methyltransferase